MAVLPKSHTFQKNVLLHACTHGAQSCNLIVSGVADTWVGVQFIKGPKDGYRNETTDDTVMATGGEGLLSLPAGENLSIQSDFKYEYNGNAFRTQNNGDVIGPEYMFQGAST